MNDKIDKSLDKLEQSLTKVIMGKVLLNLIDHCKKEHENVECNCDSLIGPMYDKHLKKE